MERQAGLERFRFKKLNRSGVTNLKAAVVFVLQLVENGVGRSKPILIFEKVAW